MLNRITIVDSDCGTDPDDTAVAIIVANHYEHALLVSNDETTTYAKARFLRHVAGDRHPIAAGLPSLKQRTTDNADSAGLVPVCTVATNAVEQIIATLSAHTKVDYIGLGALTNLDAALAIRPDLATRVALYQMGPAIHGGFDRPRAQYNARIDPLAFRRVIAQVPLATLVMTHTTWGFPASPPPLGVFPGDPLATALAASPRRDHAIYTQHLAAFVASGKDCSILHDPATLLVPHHPELFDFVELDVILDDAGWLHLTDLAVDMLGTLPPDRLVPIARALTGWRAPPPGMSIGLPNAPAGSVRVRLSLAANVTALRARIAELLLTTG